MSNNEISFVEFGKIAEFRNGLNFSKENHGSGCWLIGVSDFQNNFSPDYKSLEEVNPKGITKENDYLKKGDILFVRSNGNKALVGRSLYVDQNIKALFSGFCIRARLTSDLIEPLFLAYFTRTKHFKSAISFVAGTNINNLNQDILADVKLPLYSKEKQLLITNVLSALDAKIELNNRINAELEAMAKTLYDYWFVQFDFPDENGKPYKSSGGKMIWNNELKREIPDGWEVKNLSELSNITMGQSPSGESYNEEGSGIIFYQGCTDFGNRFPTVRKFTTEPTRFAKAGDILLSVRAPVGTLNIANTNCCIGRGLAALNSKQNAIAFLFGVMQNLKQIFDRRNVDGTTFGSITKDDLFSLRIVVPKDEKLIKDYQSKVNAAFQKQNEIETENQKLAELRDWLLPMLMNGQVTVKETSKSLEFEKPLPNFAETNAGKAKQRETYQQIQVLYTTIWANKEINVRQGEMATAKDVYLLDRIFDVPTNFNFANHNWGAFDPKEKQLLNTTQYFHKPNFPNSQAYYLDLKDDGKLLEIISAELKEQIANGISEMNDKVFNRYFGKEKARMKELYATVLKCIEDSGSLLLTEIRNKMALWKIKQDGIEITKAEKFTEEETVDALNTIVFENWHRNILPKSN